MATQGLQPSSAVLAYAQTSLGARIINPCLFLAHPLGFKSPLRTNLFLSIKKAPLTGAIMATQGLEPRTLRV